MPRPRNTLQEEAVTCPDFRRPSRSLATALMLIAAWLNPSALNAQAADGDSDGSWAIGGSIGLPGYESHTEPSLFVIGVQFSQLRPGKLGGDVSLGTMPRGLFHGFIPLGIRTGGVLPLPISEHWALLPSAGVSIIAGLGSGGGVAEAGANIGVGVLGGDLDSTAFRGGITWHRFRGAGRSIWLLEIGFVRRR